MQTRLPQLTTILLLIHLGFGCCFHHAHACELDPCRIETAHVGGCESHLHCPAVHSPLKDYNESPSSLERERSHSHACSGENCTFVAVRPRLVISIEESNHYSSLVVPNLSDVATSTRGGLLAGRMAREFEGTALARLHLTLQVLQL